MSAFVAEKCNSHSLSHVVNKRQSIPKGQYKKDNLEKLATDEEKKNKKKQHNMCWTPLYENKHK